MPYGPLLPLSPLSPTHRCPLESIHHQLDSQAQTSFPSQLAWARYAQDAARDHKQGRECNAPASGCCGCCIGSHQVCRGAHASSCFTETSLTYEHGCVIRQTIKKNRKEATELAEHAEEIAKAVIDVPLLSDSTQVDEHYEEHVLALQRCVIISLSFVAVPSLNDNDTLVVNSWSFLSGWRS